MHVYDAAAGTCTDEVKGADSQRLVRVQMSSADGGGILSIKINEDVTAWERTESELTDVLKTRRHKVVFLQADLQVGQEDIRRMMTILRNAGVRELCVIDPAHPPTWHFPPAEPAGGSASDFVGDKG